MTLTRKYMELKSILDSLIESSITRVHVQYDDDPDMLNAVRQSLYGYAKSYAEHFPAGHITKPDRENRWRKIRC